MNTYGAMAQRHWRQWLPRRYQTIPNPTQFFSRLGEQTAEQVQNLTDHLAGPDQPHETYLGKLGRITNARQRAEEVVLPELVLLPPETDEQPSSASLDQPEALSGPEWIPVIEDPEHPFWQQSRIDEP